MFKNSVCTARRQLEQRCRELSFSESQQQRANEPEQQHWLPARLAYSSHGEVGSSTSDQNEILLPDSRSRMLGTNRKGSFRAGRADGCLSRGLGWPHFKSNSSSSLKNISPAIVASERASCGLSAVENCEIRRSAARFMLQAGEQSPTG